MSYMNTIFKKTVAFFTAMLMTMMLSACSDSDSSKKDDSNSSKTKINISVLKGPTGMGAAKLMSDDEAGTTVNDYDFKIASAPDEITAAVVSGNVDICAVPANLGAVLYSKTKGDVEVVAVNTLGVLYLLENGNTIHSVADLKGKTIYATGQASTPEYALRYILTKNGINPDEDVKIEYKTEHAELAALMASDSVVLGVLPEPNVTSTMAQNSKLRIALDLNEEWSKCADDDSTLVMGTLIVSKKFAQGNKEALDAFLTEYKASVDYANNSPKEASVLIEKYGIVAKAALAEKAISNCNITYLDGDSMKTQLSSFLNILYTFNQKSVGGKLPDDAFYYKK